MSLTVLYFAFLNWSKKKTNMEREHLTAGEAGSPAKKRPLKAGPSCCIQNLIPNGVANIQ